MTDDSLTGRQEPLRVELTLRLPAGRTAPGDARRALNGIAAFLGRDLVEDLELMVTELVTNAIRHGGLAASDRVEVTLTLSADLLRVEVADPGTGFDHAPVMRRAGGAHDSGWGLFLVGKLSDRWGIVDGDLTRVWFEVDHLDLPSRPGHRVSASAQEGRSR